MNEALIGKLVAELKPVRGGALERTILAAMAAGTAVAAVLMLFWLGLRPDLVAAMGGGVFWIKLAYAGALALLALPVTLALARPDGRMPLWPWIALAALAATMVAAAWMQLTIAPPSLIPRLIHGATALVCPLYILAVSMPVLVAALAAMRRMAPTRASAAGGAAGLAAGSLGALVYAFHCPEFGLPFLLVWYNLGIVVVAALGAFAGRYVLRW